MWSLHLHCHLQVSFVLPLSQQMDETTRKWQCLDSQMTWHDATSVEECTGYHQPSKQPAINTILWSKKDFKLKFIFYKGWGFRELPRLLFANSRLQPKHCYTPRQKETNRKEKKKRHKGIGQRFLRARIEAPGHWHFVWALSLKATNRKFLPLQCRFSEQSNH